MSARPLRPNGPMFHVLIIGAGPAGSLAAILLARHRWRVTLIEQHPFPRHKVCGECLSALGLDVLRRANLLGCLDILKPARLVRAALHAPDGSTVRVPLATPMWGLSRAALDAALLNQARAVGVTVFQPARCESLRPTDLGVEVGVRDLSTNQLTEFTAQTALLADGKGALLPARPLATTDFGMKAHFRQVCASRDSIELFGVSGGYGGVAPIEGDRWNAAFNVPAARIQRSRGDLDRLFDETLSTNPELRRQFSRAVREGDWLAAPLPRFAVAPAWPDHVIPLGNAAAALEPIGGEGIGLALRSAELAVASLLEEPRAATRPALRRSFAGLWQTRRAACRFAARMLSSPTFASPAVQFIASNEALAGVAMRLMGKPATI